MVHRVWVAQPFCRILAVSLSLCVVSIVGQTKLVRNQETVSIHVNEGTTLAFDISPDGKSLVFDLLGQLWLLPAKGGVARPITDGVRDVSEDLDPSFSPDGRQIVFRGERNGRTGLWLLNLKSGAVKQLTQLSDPTGFDGSASWSPDGRFIAYIHTISPDASNRRGRIAIMLLEVASGTTRELLVTGLPVPLIGDPVWLSNEQLAFVTRFPLRERGGRIWTVATTGGAATPLTGESVEAIAPAASTDGKWLAYLAPDGNGRLQVWSQELTASNQTARKLTDHLDVTPTRVRWTSGGSHLIYSADGRLWSVAASGGPPSQIPFSADLRITRSRTQLPPARFPEPGREERARGFMGLALSPDARNIGMLALGKLWIIHSDGSARAVAEVPFEANSLAWSPDSAEVAWSAGIATEEDLFATNISTGATRRVTALPGQEAYPTYSPDGRYLAFVHLQKEEGTLRVVETPATNIDDVAKTTSLGVIGLRGASTPQWSPESDGLLVSGEANERQPSVATFIPLKGERQTINRFPDAPIFFQWTAKRILYVRHDRLWSAPFDRSGLLAEPKPIGNDAALYASAARDGSLVYVSDGGLKLLSPEGTARRLGWPLSYTPPVPEATLIRNVRIIDGTGAPITGASDILIERGRIARIAPTGSLSAKGVRVFEGAGRIVIPGLIDLHAHIYRPDLLPGFVYFGVTTIRDQGSSMAPLVAYANAIAAGVLPGPRVGFGGFQFYSDWSFDEEQGRGIEPEADPEHIKRAIDLAQAFGAQHIKTRTFRRWDINARMISQAHQRGLRATGHCSHLLPLVAAGMDAKEHIGACEARGSISIYDDLIQLYRAAKIGVVPTITYYDFAVRVNERPAILNEDSELAPFLPLAENFEWMIKMDAAQHSGWIRWAGLARETTAKLLRGGVTLGTGTDIWQIPTGVHMELEQLVAAGLSPMQAIHAGTGSAAKILGADNDLGTIAVGKWADIVFLDADPLADIRNSRRIWQVMHNGQLIDRPTILKVIHPKPQP